MARRRESEKRDVLPDPKYNSKLVSMLMSVLLQEGKKATAEKICYGAFDILGEKTGVDSLKVFKAAVENVKPLVEVKPRRVGGATYQVPLEVPSDRQFSLALRWIVDFADGRKGIPMKEALASEILEAYQGQGNAIRKRDEVHKMAQANKAFAHFRW